MTNCFGSHCLVPLALLFVLLNWHSMSQEGRDPLPHFSGPGLASVQRTALSPGRPFASTCDSLAVVVSNFALSGCKLRLGFHQLLPLDMYLCVHLDVEGIFPISPHWASIFLSRGALIHSSALLCDWSGKRSTRVLLCCDTHRQGECNLLCVVPLLFRATAIVIVIRLAYYVQWIPLIKLCFACATVADSDCEWGTGQFQQVNCARLPFSSHWWHVTIASVPR